jgi:hypothetical protein
MPALSILFGKLFNYLPEDLKQFGLHPSSGRQTATACLVQSLPEDLKHACMHPSLGMQEQACLVQFASGAVLYYL